MSKKNIYLEIVERIEKNEPVVLATVTESHGSTPQEKGCSAIFGTSGLIFGTVGGGRVEHEMQQKAVAAAKTKKPGYFRFDLKDDIDEPDSVICGGGMSILLDAAPEKHSRVFEALVKSYSNRIPGVLVTFVRPGANEDFRIDRFWISSESDWKNSDVFSREVTDEIMKMLDSPTLGAFHKIVQHTSPDVADDYYFLENIVPQPQLIIAGAGHVGRALSHQGKLLGFDVIVWDDRDEYANSENLPDADTILAGKLDEELEKLKVSNDTYIVIVTRGHKQDADVLKKFITTDAAYIGMIGSRKKVMQVKEKSLNEGWATTEQWEGVYAPIGLDINSKTVEEIAVSIAAQLIQVRYQLNNNNG